MAETPWGWIIGSVVVGAAAGMLLSAGDVRRNPYEGSGRKRRKGRKNPAEYEDFGLDPNARDFEAKLAVKKKLFEKGLEQNSSGLVAVQKRLAEIPAELANLREEATALDKAVLKARLELSKEEIKLFKKFIKEHHPAETEIKPAVLKEKYPIIWEDSDALRWRFSASLKPLKEQLATAEKKLAEKQGQVGKAVTEKAKLKRELSGLTPEKANSFRQQLDALEEIRYRRELEEDEEDAAELKRNQQLAAKGLRLMKSTDHQKSHQAKRRVRKNK